MTDVTAGTDVRGNDTSHDLGSDAAAVTQRPPFEETAKASTWRKAVRVLRTARHLKARQALFWAIRRGWGRSYRIPVQAEVRTRQNVRLQAELASPDCGLAENEVEFLNIRRRFDGGIDWRSADYSRLWQYNLHYFDYALDTGRSPGWVRGAMEDWVERNPPGKSVGWEPYPVSLRIVNWIKFDLRPSHSGQLPSSCRRSLYQQLWWLERNLEHEIQANHLLKNAKALFFGGAYFSGEVPDRWLRTGRKLFLQQVEEQIQPDGGHYERSAMYHAIALQDMLDVLSLSLGRAGLMSDADVAALTRRAGDALHYLQDLTFPGGRLPMFNDSVAGIAPETASLRSYARAILPAFDAPLSSDAALIDKPNTGYYGYRQGAEMLLIDAGAPAPSYQPGHSHCGLLGFELAVAGRPVIVDSGVYDYEATPLRQLLRSTAAHNTIRIDRGEQSEIWGAFRIGRRGRPGRVSLSADLPDRFCFAGSHDGYRSLAGHPIHRRAIACRIGQCWHVADDIVGRGSHLAESFLHFHPSFQLEKQGDAWIAGCQESGLRFRITATGGSVERQPSTYCPQFGVRHCNWMLVLRSEAVLPARLTYTIEKL
jgi:uncharacterized heparinase superfamily protein